MGKLLLPFPSAKTLRAARSLDNPQAVVTSRSSMEEHELEGISDETVAFGVQAGQPYRADTFSSDRESPVMKAGCGKTARPV
jgi:hypothetical protein